MTDDAGSTTENIEDIINDAEEVVDPLDGLAERTAADPGAPFATEVLERLAALRKEDRAAFEKLRAELKAAGCRVTALDDALGEAGGDDGGRGPPQAETLIQIAEAAELFHTPDGTAFADIDIDGHRETWPVRSKGFKSWLIRRYYEETDGAPNSEARQSALNVIEAKASYKSPERIVHVRVGEAGGRTYLDLANPTWQAVEIDAGGWRVVDAPPVRFRRAAGMLPLPMPVTGGSIEELRSFLNVPSNIEFILIVAWCLAALRAYGPYPVLATTGEHGAAKSTLTRILRLLIDPNTSPLRSLPRDDVDFFISATRAHILGYDNISGLTDWVSDALARLATGGGIGKRQLYTDMDEVLLDATRPIMLNGIEEVVSRPDLADRTLFMTLKPIPEDKRRLEKDILAEFEKARPRILGVLLDAVATGLERQHSIKPARLPRMADFAKWVMACETAFWPADTFEQAYAANRDEAVEIMIDASPVATAIRAMMTNLATLKPAKTEWTGTATALLRMLSAAADEKTVRSKSWPQDGRALSGALRRSASNLRKIGIDVAFWRAGRGRTITITTTPSFSVPGKVGNSASSPSPASPNGDFSNDFNDLVVTQTDEPSVTSASPSVTSTPPGVTPSPTGDAEVMPGDAEVTLGDAETVTANQLKDKGNDGDDGGDANFPSLAGSRKKEVFTGDLTPEAVAFLFAPYDPVDWSGPEEGRQLCQAQIREITGDYVDACFDRIETLGEVDKEVMERWLREKLAAAGVPPAYMDAEVERVMEKTAYY
jgi:hypothetical protein